MSDREFSLNASFPVGNLPDGFLREGGPLHSIFEPGDNYLVEIKVTRPEKEVCQ